MSASRSCVYPKGEQPELTQIPRILSREFLTEYGAEFLGDKTRLFFDYDEDVKNNPECKDDSYCKTKAKEIHNMLEGKSTNWKHPFVMTQAVQPNKISFHVVFTNQKDIIVRKEFKKEFEEELFSSIIGPENFKYIDTQVYGKKKWFRLPYGTDPKIGKTFPHIPFTQMNQPFPDLYNFVLTVPDEADTIDYSLNPAYINYKMKQLLDEERNKDVREVDEEMTPKLLEAFSMLKTERFKNQREWFLLALQLKFFGGSVELFCQMSKNSGYEKYDEKVCKKTFDSIQPEKFHIGLLCKWLKEDGVDPKTIFPTRSPIMKKLIHIAYAGEGGLTEYNIGNAIKEVYTDNLFYCDSHQWVHWNEEKQFWNFGSSKVIMKPIMELLTSEYFTWIKELKKGCAQQEPKEGESEKQFYLRIEKQLLGIKCLESTGQGLQGSKTIKSLLDYCEGICQDNERVFKFNMKSELFTFKNGLTYNLKTREIRKVVKEDYILNHCGYDYPERNEDDVLKMKELLLTMFKPDQIAYALSCMSLSLYGNNLNEVFIIFKGIGRNGKGLIADIMSVLLGNYYQTIPTEELTEDSKGKGRASSELANAQFSRCLMASEPDENVKIKTATVKKLTGRDPIEARQLYGKAFKYVSQFTLYLQCNEDPKFSKLDDALSKRIRYLEFVHQFVPEDKIIRDYQRPIRESLKEEIKIDMSYRNGLLHLLFDTWFQTKGKLIMSKEAEETHTAQMMENNPLSEFISKKQKSHHFTRIEDLRTEYNLNYPELKKKEFKDFILLFQDIKTEEDKSHGMKVFIK